MRNSRLKEEKRLLQFLDEEQPTEVPQDVFKRKTVKELQAYKLIEITASGACMLTEKGRYIKRMTSNPKIELHSRGNYILDLQFEKERQPLKEIKQAKTRRSASIFTAIVSAVLLPFQLLRTA